LGFFHIFHIFSLFNLHFSAVFGYDVTREKKTKKTLFFLLFFLEKVREKVRENVLFYNVIYSENK
jgi:hypothetical protein